MISWLIPLLTVLFVYLKLVGSIAWSWWWVLSPLWIGIPLVILSALFFAFLLNSVLR